jgi:hypothetical protein
MVWSIIWGIMIFRKAYSHHRIVRKQDRDKQKNVGTGAMIIDPHYDYGLNFPKSHSNPYTDSRLHNIT